MEFEVSKEGLPPHATNDLRSPTSLPSKAFKDALNQSRRGDYIFDSRVEILSSDEKDNGEGYHEINTLTEQLGVPKDASQVIVRASLVTPQAIHATIHKADYDEWVLAAVYASHNPVMRDHLWDDLEDVAETMDMPWLVMGDFNDFATQGERRSFNPRTTTVRNQKFLDRVNNCNLINLRSSGPNMTWTNSEKTCQHN
ncbi:hypothetical protein LOK49_LG06G02953 [Camellia lanceoleosa]|uniref:Uncharacterized protein n=1 Tax=Camellia lanceoleosa TaxID=1840588 RepID=A0ACC0HA91_9ERIC|nr:hypothetical protein LOK49_LG06G02953 [Camellia lanceoleosa]